MAQQTKSELVEELGSQATKDDLIQLLQSRLRKDDLAKLLEDESGATKEELVHKLGSRKKDELVEAVANHLTKEQIQKVVDENREDEDDSQDGDADEEEAQAQRASDADDEHGEEQTEPPKDEQSEGREDEQAEKREDAGARSERREPDWAPRPAPFGPGQRVRVDLSGLPMLGIYAGARSSAAGTIIGVDPRERQVQVYLDAVFDGEKEIVVPPERLVRE